MALIERCPNAWHMLIVRLIYAFWILGIQAPWIIISNGVISFALPQRCWRWIKSGVQVSERYSADLKEREKIPYKKKGVTTALRGKVSAG